MSLSRRFTKESALRCWMGIWCSFKVAMTGARDENDAVRYAECAAAQYALIRGYGFARLVRTNVYKEGGISHADAVYTISPTLPRGTKTIDAEVKVADCAAQGYRLCEDEWLSF